MYGFNYPIHISEFSLQNKNLTKFVNGDEARANLACSTIWPVLIDFDAPGEETCNV